jgi:hemerythrin
MAFTAAHLKMVNDHIASGERHVIRQREILDSLRANGHPTQMAEELLVEFQATLKQHCAHRDKMMQEMAAETTAAMVSPGVRPRSRARKRPTSD